MRHGFFLPALLVALALQGQTALSEPLRDAVRRALGTNPALKASSAEMQASAYEMLQTQEEFLPTVELYGELGLQRVDDPAFLPDADNDISQTRSQIGLNARLVLFDGFRRANLVYARAARLDGNIFRLLDASETMALNATEAYIDVVRHRSLLGVARRNLAQHREIETRVRALVDGGRLPNSDLLTIQDRVEAASLAINDVERALRDADARYERVIGVPPGGGMAIRSAQVPPSLNTLTQAAIARNFRVLHAQTRIDESRYNRDIVLSDNLPQLSLNAGTSYGVNRNGLTGDRTDAYIGLGFNWTLYQGGRKPERNRLAELQYRAAYERDVAVRAVRELSAQAWNTYVSTADRAAMLRRQLRINRLIVDAYAEEFDAAKRTLLDLLEVERARFNVEFQSVSADASLAFSTYRALAVQSALAQHFGVARSDMALEPTFQARAKASRGFVFETTIEPLR
ncbi:outer membrane protein, adhesin transport system [Cribrihabitans marinus]|uniref:Outer membrane protein, adhesin transport system n=1 Tax=Cribrihabitans marinus TaxID=1227549 RepID=A0A1H7B3D8_9RHOB|nr:TolC family protein [Cribrihabitans marinus]GGH32481.1 membrane protein [Cribrihabitans marinus]SEJ68760.1 outer membrane protein, adhesin transport system [Cribrihabitans marinus]